MGIGTAVRTRLGRFETPAAEAYRAAFVNLDALAEGIAEQAGDQVRRVLEVGCGDGAMADRLTRVFPQAAYVGIDVAPEPGRRFTGDRERAVFTQMTSTAFRGVEDGCFDVTVLVDVIHHIPSEADRHQVLADAAALTAEDGLLVVKDWDAQRSFGHGLQVIADRWISGDRTVRFQVTDYFVELARRVLPEWECVWLGGVRPWRNNVVLGWRRSRSETSLPS
jgi:2-polyprenyl-6-hydroxyphenyl methylase/3-demethylubiquinone-9 3-methyltransferase